MITILAEKPSVARDIARVLGVGNRKDGYLSNNQYNVTWAFGHLVKLAPPDAYGEQYKKWTPALLPIIPTDYKLELIENPGSKKQFNTIKKLVKESKEIICATDAGREGELIFRLIYEKIGEKMNSKLPIKRLWISSLTDEAIKEGFNNLKDASDYQALYDTAISRAKADWLVGLNSTRAITTKVNRGNVYSLGRVQTPTFVLVVKRYLEHINFVPTTFWQPDLVLEAESIEFIAKYAKAIHNKADAEALVENFKSKTEIDVATAEKKNKSEQPPLLFDLTNLQKRCNSLFGYTAQKTLDIAQKLYEAKRITYPRTESRYLSNDMKKAMPTQLKKLMQIPTLKTDKINLEKLNYSSRYFNNAKVTDHHAIIPSTQRVDPASLSKDEANVYMLIAASLVQSFMPNCLKELTTYTFTEEGHTFISKGTVIKVEGWREISVFASKNDAEEKLPNLKKGDTTKIIDIKNPERKTKAPPLLTEAMLLSMMERAGDLVEVEEGEEDDEEIENKFSLGTPATRASIIELLQKREYIKKQGKALVPSENGLFIYDVIKGLPLADIKTTGKWEYALKCIQNESLSKDKFQSEIEKYTHNLISEILALKPPPAPAGMVQNRYQNRYKSKTTKTKSSSASSSAKSKRTKTASSLGLCPKCKEKVLIDYPKSLTCPDKSCGFILWKNMASKALSATALKQLIKSGETKKAVNFKSSTGKTFKARLAFDDAYKVVFKFDK